MFSQLYQLDSSMKIKLDTINISIDPALNIKEAGIVKPIWEYDNNCFLCYVQSANQKFYGTGHLILGYALASIDSKDKLQVNKIINIPDLDNKSFNLGEK